MKVRDVMTTTVAACRREDTLAHTAHLMRDYHCGILPVLDLGGMVVGVVTDRDICIASATRRVAPGGLTVSDVMTHPVHACMPDDTVESALGMMRRSRVRRLPVLDGSGHLKGILSLDDVILAYHASKEAPIPVLFETLAAVCAHRTAEVATP